LVSVRRAPSNIPLCLTSSASPYVLAENAPPTLPRAVKAVDAARLAVRRALGHLRRSSAVVARVFISAQRPGAHATQAGGIIVAKGVRMQAPAVVLIVRLTTAAAAAFGLRHAGVGCSVVGVGVGVCAGGSGLVQSEFLLLVVCLVAHAGAPGLVGIQPASCTTAPRLSAVARLFVGARCGAVVAVLELADLRVDEALDARGRGARVVGGAVRGAVLEGGDGVHGWRRQAIALGVPACVEVPAEVGAGAHEQQDYEEDEPAVHGVGLSREAACRSHAGA
jgi:hypothetical protein